MAAEYLQLSQEDYDRLSEDKWLNDTIINGYLRHLATTNPTTYFLPTQLYQKVERIRGFSSIDGKDRVHASVKKWLPPDITQYDTVILPANTGSHWVVSVASIVEDGGSYRLKVATLDSLSTNESKKVGPLLMNILWKEMEDRGIELIEQEVRIRSSPQQGNSNDCGVYSLLNVEKFLELKSYVNSNSWFGEEQAVEARERLKNIFVVKEWEVTSLLQTTYGSKKRYIITSQELARRVQEPECLPRHAVAAYLRKRKEAPIPNEELNRRVRHKNGKLTLFSKICEGEAADVADEFESLMTEHLSHDILPAASTPERILKVQGALDILQELEDGMAEHMADDSAFSLTTHTFGPKALSSCMALVRGCLSKSLQQD